MVNDIFKLLQHREKFTLCFLSISASEVFISENGLLKIMEEEVGKLCMQLDAEDMVDGWVLLLDSGGGSSRPVN